MTTGTGALDALIIGGDQPQEVLGTEVRESLRLTIDGTPASLAYLKQYILANRNAALAAANLRRQTQRFISLNGPYLQQYLQKKGFDVALIPLLGAESEVLANALARGPRAVVISTTFLPFRKQIDNIAGAIKARCPDTTVIAGGIQIWKSYRHKLLLDSGGITEDIRSEICEHNYLMDPTLTSPVDALVISDSGEATLAALLGRLRNGAELSDMENVALFKDGRWELGPVVAEGRNDVAVDWGQQFPTPVSSFVPVQAGIGCGFRCTFCDFCGLRQLQLRSASSIVDEIKTITPCNGVRRVYFTDDNLFGSRPRAREICLEMARAHLGVRWRGMIRIAAVNEEIADLMAESGCLEVLLGIESGDAEILRRMQKNVTPDQILSGVEMLAERGINTKSTFIIGFPGETDRSIQNTVDLLNSYPVGGQSVHRYLFFTFAVLPLSSIAGPASRERYGLRGYGYNWSHDTMDAAQAAHRLAAAHDAVRLELSPSYLLEVPELDGLAAADIQRVFVARNKLAKARRGIGVGAPEEQMWAEIEAAMQPALKEAPRATLRCP